VLLDQLSKLHSMIIATKLLYHRTEPIKLKIYPSVLFIHPTVQTSLNCIKSLTGPFIVLLKIKCTLRDYLGSTMPRFGLT
jgi:hypothetical protein